MINDKLYISVFDIFFFGIYDHVTDMFYDVPSMYYIGASKIITG